MSELYELPIGWEWKTIEDVLSDIKTGTTPPKKEQKYYDNPSIKWFSPSDFGEHKELIESKNKINEIAIKDKKAKVYQPNSLLLVAIGATVGKIGIVRNEASSNQQITSMNFKDDVDVDFSYYWFVRMKQTIIDTASAATLPIINQNGIKSLPFPLTSLSEQQRIVSKLDLLFEKIDKSIALHQKNMDEANVFMGSVLNDVFGELEEKYEKKQLKEIVDNYDGKRIPIKSFDRESMSGEYPYYGASGIIDYVNDYIFDGEYLLISEDGANLTVRKYPIAFIANGKFWVNNHAHIVSAKENISTNKYMEYIFAYTNISGYITGSAQPKMSQGKMNLIEFVIPPLNIQQKVVKYLDEISQKIEKIKQAQKAKMNSLKALKASILDQAFKGEL